MEEETSMEQKALSRWLKLILIGLGVCGLVVHFLILPLLGRSLVESHPEFSCGRWAWLFFLWLAGVPCYAALWLGWRIATNIGRDRSFTSENARALKRISQMAAGDTLYFFVGNVVFLLLKASRPEVALVSFLIVFTGAAIAVASAALSHLPRKAATLQEQSDLTI